MNLLFALFPPIAAHIVLFIIIIMIIIRHRHDLRSFRSTFEQIKQLHILEYGQDYFHSCP